MPAVAPFGLKPVRKLDGSPFNDALMLVAVPASNGTDTFVGDVLNYHTEAAAAAVTVNGQNLEGVPYGVVSADGTIGQNTIGVVVGFLPDPTALGTRYRVLSTLRIALVAPAVGVVFEVQEDGDTSRLAKEDANLNVAYTTTAGSKATGVSKFALDSSSKAATATLPLRLLGLARRPGNTYGASATDVATWEVYFNTSQFAPNIVGV